MPGRTATFTGGCITVVAGGMTIAIVSQGGPAWKGGIAVAIGLFFLLLGVWSRWRALRLWRKGASCEGEVVHAWTEELGQVDNKRTYHVVQYEYVVDGQQHLAKHGTGSLWEEGPTWVVYDPRDPSDSMPYRVT